MFAHVDLAPPTSQVPLDINAGVRVPSYLLAKIVTKSVRTLEVCEDTQWPFIKIGYP